MFGLGIPEAIFLFLSAGGAYFTKGITGFGNTLIMASLFSYLIPNRIITPVDLFLSIPTNAWLVFKNRKSLQIKMALPLSLTVLLGAVPGTLLLKSGPDWQLKAFLGLVIIGIAVDMLFAKPSGSPSKKGLSGSVWLLVMGVLSGILAGLYGISALLVSYIARNTTDREAFRANICLVFLTDNLFRLGFYGISGLITREVLSLSLWISPAVLLGMWLGVKVDKTLAEHRVRLVMIGLLLVSGIMLFIRNIGLFA